jgi:acyl carrier protein
MDARKELLSLLNETLNLEGRASGFQNDTPLLGALPEMDSMGVVAILTALEDKFGMAIDYDEIEGSVFQTFGTLLNFVTGKIA